MSFTWKPMFRELAGSLLNYEEDQQALIGMLQRARGQGMMTGKLMDKPTEDGPEALLDELDPFTFFGTFNRGQATARRQEILELLKDELGLESDIPADFDGVPVMNAQRSWFIGYKYRRGDEDVSLLWRLVRQAIEGGISGVDGELFDRCLAIYGVAIRSLSMGLFWMRPDEFLPIDGTMKGAIGSLFGAWPTDWATYVALMDRVRREIHPDFDWISLMAYDHADGLRQRRYWAGGHHFGETDVMEPFERAQAWWLGWPRDTDDPWGQKMWRRAMEIKAGDWMLIKGYGGTHDLVVHRMCRVTAMEPGHARIHWEPLDRSLYSGEAPRGAGAGNWRHALLEVKRPGDIALLFGVEQRGQPPEPAPSPSTTTAPIDGAPNRILYGPPGTGKTWQVQRELKGRGVEHTFVTLHQSFGYEDFVEGIRPRVKKGKVIYRMEDGLFKKAAEAALESAGYGEDLDTFCHLKQEERSAILEDAPPYVVIIDEINRGNVARIFGELLTLIEPSKRLGGADEQWVTLPGSQERFGVPANLSIVGTMNTADRSVDALDAALRRRFEFVECPPLPGKVKLDVQGVQVHKLLRAINARIEVLLDRDHRIGHTPFLPLHERPRLKLLRRIFRRQIIPQIQDYFFDDWRRIGLILGEGFVRSAPQETAFMDFPGADELTQDVPQRFRLTRRKTWTAEVFRAVYE